MDEKVRRDAIHIALNETVLEFQLKRLKELHSGDELELAVHYLSGLTSGMSCDQLHIKESGESGKGKSHVAESVIKLFPPEHVFTLASISPKALFYVAREDDLDGKILFFDEAEASEGSIPLLRILTSSRSQRSSLQHWTVNDKKQAEKMKIEGRQVIWLNSSNPIEDDQLLNRFLICNPDESRERDRKVYELQRENYCSGRENVPDVDFSLNQEVTRQVLDENWNVVIPFGEFIELPSIENRRNAPKFFTLVKACTQANINQRKSFDSPKIRVLIATREDYETALVIWEALQQLTETKASQSALNLLEKIPLDKAEALGNEQLAEETSWDSATVRRLTRELYMNGLVNYTKPDRAYLYYRPTVRSWNDLCNTVDWQNFESIAQNKPESLSVLRIPKLQELVKENIAEITKVTPFPKTLHSYLKLKKIALKPKNSEEEERVQQEHSSHSSDDLVVERTYIGEE